MNKNISKLHRSLLPIIILILSAWACKKNDQPEDDYKLKLSSNEVRLQVNETKEIMIVAGLAPFEITNSQTQDIVSVELNKNTIKLLGRKEGSTELNILSKNKESVKLKVEVKGEKEKPRHYNLGIYPKNESEKLFLESNAIAETDLTYALYEDLGNPYLKRIILPVVDSQTNTNDELEKEIYVQGIKLNNNTEYKDLTRLKLKGKIVFKDDNIVVMESQEYYVGFSVK